MRSPLHASVLPLRARLLVAALALCGLPAPAAHALILTSGDFQTGAPVPTLEIALDLTFQITSSGDARFMILDEWIVSDGLQEGTATVGIQLLTYSLDGAPDQTVELTNLIDNVDVVLGDVTPNDGALLFDAIGVTAGDTLVIRSATYTFVDLPNLNPAIPAVFSGDLFLADADLNALSGPASVPEPAALLLVLAGAPGLRPRSSSTSPI